jgi:hypothetical protein
MPIKQKEMEISFGEYLIISKGIFTENMAGNNGIRDNNKCLGAKCELINRAMLET